MLVLFIIIGIIITFALIMALAEFGLIILAGVAFGILMYIAVKVNRITQLKTGTKSRNRIEK